MVCSNLCFHPENKSEEIEEAEVNEGSDADNHIQNLPETDTGPGLLSCIYKMYINV